MGLFQQRPEEPTEWAGLPSEPVERHNAAEHLADATAPDALGLGAGSISIPLPATPAPDDAP